MAMTPRSARRLNACCAVSKTRTSRKTFGGASRIPKMAGSWIWKRPSRANRRGYPKVRLPSDRGVLGKLLQAVPAAKGSGTSDVGDFQIGPVRPATADAQERWKSKATCERCSTLQAILWFRSTSAPMRFTKREPSSPRMPTQQARETRILFFD